MSGNSKSTELIKRIKPYILSKIFTTTLNSNENAGKEGKSKTSKCKAKLKCIY
jgi:hypothetical protein